MLMKDGLARPAALRIAQALNEVDKNFKVDTFVEQATYQLEELELKERLTQFIQVLAKHLPADFSQAAVQLKACKQYWDYGDSNDNLRSFAAWPLLDYVGEHGLHQPEIALDVLYELTELFSAEFAIRPFLVNHNALTLAKLNEWLNDKNHHVRRLVSEGCRPRLPWGIRLQQYCQDPTPLLPLLSALNNDTSDYVRRSVANNLNDIAKDHPELVISTCKTWQKHASKETLALIKHACRGLIKSGKADVFPLLGFTEKPNITVNAITLVNHSISLGEQLTFNFAVTSKSNTSQKLAIDYAIHHVKANGQLTAKVFKLKELTLTAGKTVLITKNHHIKAITTRKYYSGEHQLELLINGQSYQTLSFNLQT